MSELRFSYKPNKNSEAIAINKDNNKLIYLNEDSDIEDDVAELFHEYIRYKAVPQKDFDALLEAIVNNEPPEDNRKLRVIYDGFQSFRKKSTGLRADNIQVVPLIGNDTRDNKTRETVLVSGGNGVGKSHWAGSYVKKWAKLFPKSPIWLISNKPLKDEPAFDNLNITQIPIDLENLSELTSDEQAPYEHFISKTGQSLLICDDFETDSKLETMVYKIINSVLRVGRASRIYCLIISHALCNGKKSKVFFQEVDSIVIFPKSISPYTAKYMLSNYTTMDSKGADRLLNSTSRWVYIHKSFPHYVIESNRMWLY